MAPIQRYARFCKCKYNTSLSSNSHYNNCQWEVKKELKASITVLASVVRVKFSQNKDEVKYLGNHRWLEFEKQLHFVVDAARAAEMILEAIILVYDVARTPKEHHFTHLSQSVRTIALKTNLFCN